MEKCKIVPKTAWLNKKDIYKNTNIDASNEKSEKCDILLNKS